MERESVRVKESCGLWSDSLKNLSSFATSGCVLPIGHQGPHLSLIDQSAGKYSTVMWKAKIGDKVTTIHSEELSFRDNRGSVSTIPRINEQGIGIAPKVDLDRAIAAHSEVTEYDLLPDAD